MATTPSWPAWFNATLYLNNKADQLNAVTFEGKTDWTAASTEATFTARNISPYDHYVAYGNAENVSPNAMFNVAEYLASKAAQLNTIKFEGKDHWTEADVLASFKAAGISAWDHYTQFGTAEGINPSNQFDTTQYLADKLADLQATDPDALWTMDSMLAAFKSADLNPVKHFQLFGQTEGLTTPEVPQGEKVVTNYSPYTPSSPGTVFLLGTGPNTITGTANDDSINGVLSYISSEGTLHNTDKIDGTAGTDTLTVNMKGNFAGFTTGSMTNVEHVDLTNEGTISRAFSAKGVTGVDTWNLSTKGAPINLSDLSSAEQVTVNVLGQQSGSTTIQFTDKAVEGTNDSLTLGLNNVGTNAIGNTAPKYVAVNAAGIENLHVKTTGDTFADLSNAATSSITLSGAGNLAVQGVASSLTSFDASTHTGNVSANLGAAAGISTIKGGSGDDAFVVSGLGGKASIEGGEGKDSLTVKSATAVALSNTMHGVESVIVEGAGSNVAIIGKNMSGLEGVSLHGADASVTTTGINAEAFSLSTVGANAGTAIINDAAPLSFNTVAEDGALSNIVTTTLTASKATSATVNVGQHTQVQASLTFVAADSVQLNIASGKGANGGESTNFTGTVNAVKAQSFIVDAKGALGTGTGGVATADAEFILTAATSVTVTTEQASFAKFVANAATDVTITAAKDFTFSAGTSFAKAQNVTLLQHDGALSGGVAFADLNLLTVSGEGKDSKVTLGDLGGNSAQNHSLTVNASGLAKGFKAAAVNAGTNDVTLNFTDVTGTVLLDSVTGQNISINAAEMGTTATGAITASGDVHINAMGVIGGNTATTKAFNAAGISAGPDKDINLSFDGNSAMHFGALSASNKGSITINAVDYLGRLGHTPGVDGKADAIFGTIEADRVTIVGADSAANTFAGSVSSFTTLNPGPYDLSAIKANTLHFTGGIGDDTVYLFGKGGANSSMEATINTGLGVDKVEIIAAADTRSVKIAGDMGGEKAAPYSYTILAMATNAATTDFDISALQGYNESSIFHTAVGEALITVKGGADKDLILLNSAARTISGSFDTGTDNDTVVILADKNTETITAVGNLGGDEEDNISVEAGIATTKIDIHGLTGYATSSLLARDSTTGSIEFISGAGEDEIVLQCADTATQKNFTITVHSGAGVDKLHLNSQANVESFTVNGNLGGDNGDDIYVFGVATIDISLLKGYTTSALNGGLSAVTTTVIGGDGDDIIKSDYSKNSTLTGGGGNDIITLADHTYKIVLGAVASAGIDSIAKFSADDTFIFSGTTATAFTQGFAADNAASLTIALDLLSAQAENTATAFTLANGDIYGFINGATAGYQMGEDAVVKLSGVVVTDLVKWTTTIDASI